MTSELCRATISNKITSIETARENQESMDKIYDSLCHTIKAEMEATIQRYEATRHTSKRFKIRKPYWSDELQHLWDTMRIKENDFLKCRDNNQLRKRLRMDYTSARNSFDKALKQSEPAYSKLQAIEIEDMSTTNPTKFWRKIQHLGPVETKISQSKSWMRIEVFLLLKKPCSNDGNMTFITYTIVKKNQTLTKCIMIAQKYINFSWKII